MHAPFSHADPIPRDPAPSCAAAPAVTIEESAGPPQRIDLPQGRDAVLIPLSSTTLSAFPGIAPVPGGPGTVLFVPADTCASAAFAEEHSAIILLIDPELRCSLDAALAPHDLRVPDTAFLTQDAAHVRTLVPLLRRFAAAQGPGAALALRALAEVVLHEIAAASHAAPAISAPRRTGSTRLQPRHLQAIDRFIDQNIEGVLRIDDLAGLVGLSRYHFLRCFKRATGLSPLQYVLAKRVERARRLLAESSESIAAIAYATGFSSQSHLNAMFKRHFGITPGAFLKARREGRPHRPAVPRLTATPAHALALVAS